MSEYRIGSDHLPDDNEPSPRTNTAVADPSRLRIRQQSVLAVIGVGLFAVVMGGMWFAGSGASGSDSPADAAYKQFHVPGQSLNEREVWMAGGEVQLNQHAAQLKELQLEIVKWKDLQGQQQKAIDNANRINSERRTADIGPIDQVGLPPGRPPSSRDVQPLMSAFTPPPVIPAASAGGGAIGPLPPGAPPRLSNAAGDNGENQPVRSGSTIFNIKLNEVKEGSAAEMREPQPKASVDGSEEQVIDAPKKVGTYLPAATITSAILLSGLDAPTSGQAQSNPHPVVLVLRDNSILPNRYRARTKECRIIGAGYGDISSERAYIRTETLSCVLRNKRIVEVPLRGHVAGEDGKTGVRGRLVRKDGQLLAMGLLASLGSGLGQSLTQAASTISISPLGATQTVDPSKVLERSAYTGAGNSLSQLATYYITLAEKIFPIIEVAAGRTVDVVITGGVFLDADINEQAAFGNETDDEELL